MIRSAALAAFLLAASRLWADGIGYPSRSANLDVLPGFQNPPAGYGEVGFYWWLGDPLTRERLTWQLDQLKGKSVSALQINYAHSDRGGRSYGLTFPSEPALFSEPWWDLFGWFLKEAKSRGMAASLSDYTLGWAGNGWYMDEMLKDHPEAHGAVLAHETRDCSGACTWEVAAEPVSLTAYRLQDQVLSPDGAVDLRARLKGRSLQWEAPAGRWRIVSVYVKDEPVSIDPMHPLSGKQMIEKFFDRFEKRVPGEAGKGLNFFFSDELSFGVRGWLWNRNFAAEFQKHKSYDVVPEVASLFVENGPRTVKIRLDYSDVMVALSEENYFKPLYEWHHSRGMLYGCDHGGRGRDVTEFGDYFRTQRWMTGPGNDQPRLGTDLIKDKVASSIAHLYERPRTWLEGFYSSGWGTTPAHLVKATWTAFAHGHNLLTLHGLYYSTHGGWWEWAPPCNHFRMPYWDHMGEFLRAVERMSYLLSQGVHRADVAIVYPVAAVEAGPGGKDSVASAFALAERLYEQGIDFDFIDFESLARATVADKMLKVSGEEYRMLVIPSMRVVRHSTLAKAVEFHRAGGAVTILGRAPQASERIGEGDPEVAAMAKELADNIAESNQDVIGNVRRAFPRDVVCKPVDRPQMLHRKAGARDIYMLYNVERGAECTFRMTGAVELWDPWTGATSPLSVVKQTADSTTVRMPLEKSEAQIIVFSSGKATVDERVDEDPTELPVTGDWEFELKPTLDNRFGDYRLPATPALIGAEARQFRYAGETLPGDVFSRTDLDDSKWQRTTYGYGPRFWKLGPLPAQAEVPADVDVSAPVNIGGREYRWQPYEFSWRFGIEGDPGHQGYHGLKASVPGDFIALGKREEKATTTVYTAEEGGTRYYLWSTVSASRNGPAAIVQGGDLPAAVWINGKPVEAGARSAALRSGANAVLLRYDKPSRGHFLLAGAAFDPAFRQSYPLASGWFGRSGILPFDTRPKTAAPAGWYRTTSPPGLRALTLRVLGKATVWIDGARAAMPAGRSLEDGSLEYRVNVQTPRAGTSKIAIRVEQERGSYAGAAFPEPVLFDCGPGTLAAGDWSRIDGLASYSGGAWYRKNITLSAEQASSSTWLDLGDVSASAEVRVNGARAGVKLAPPYRFDISKLVKAGPNRVEVLVYSALSNHYLTIPTRYRAPGPSGLLGPVRLLTTTAASGSLRNAR